MDRQRVIKGVSPGRLGEPGQRKEVPGEGTVVRERDRQRLRQEKEVNALGNRRGEIMRQIERGTEREKRPKQPKEVQAQASPPQGIWQ